MTRRATRPDAQELGFRELLVGLVDAWREHGLLAVTASAADQIHTIGAVLTGFMAGGIAAPPGEDFPPERRADLLGHTIKAAREPSVRPDEATIRTAARSVLAVLADARGLLAGADARSVSR